MKHNGLYSQEYRGKCDRGNMPGDEIWVEGYLTILSLPFEHIQFGHYISNKDGSPFAYKVHRDSISLTNTEQSA